MKVLITGARGNFPTALIPRLLAAGIETVLFDMEPMLAPEGCIDVQADIRDAASVFYAMQDCSAVIHAAGLGAGSIGTRNYDDFYSVNVTGTHNVLRAMDKLNVRSLVLSSTDAVYGEGMRGLRVMDEKTPCIPDNYFAWTKLTAEEMCRYYARHHHIHTAILRYGSFAPAGWKTAGLGRLTNWLDREDVAMANELALGAVLAEEFVCEPFLIHCAKPFVDSDWPDLARDAEPVLERYYPGAAELLARHNLHVPHIYTRYDISKAVSVLGYDPQHNFDEFLVALAELGDIA